MRLPLPISVGFVSAILIASACGGGGPEVVPGPDPDSLAAEQARLDSIAVEQARADSIRRAAEAAERENQRRIADSLEALRRETESVRQMISSMVNFDFDRSNIRPGDDTQVLEQKLSILQANPQLRLRIVGHCDERGTDAYNLALGNRRAISARAFLTNRGVDESRVEILSRGEEQPLDSGGNEAAWARNRRAEFQIIGGGDNLRPPGM